jgi:hypothetical protein
MGAERFSSSTQHRRLARTKTGLSGAFLRANLAVGTVDFEACFDACGALACAIAFEDYRAVEDIFSEREVEVFARVGLEAEGLHGGKFVDGCLDVGGWSVLGELKGEVGATYVQIGNLRERRFLDDYGLLVSMTL